MRRSTASKKFKMARTAATISVCNSGWCIHYLDRGADGDELDSQNRNRSENRSHFEDSSRGGIPFPGLSALACLALCFVVLMESRGFADPAKYPRRTVNYQPIDLMPLLLWWEKPQGVRPLVSWKHVQGIIERETIYGWVVRGTIEGKPGLQFFLMRNPPEERNRPIAGIGSNAPKSCRTKEPQPWQSPNCQPTKAGPMTLTAAPQGFPQRILIALSKPRTICTTSTSILKRCEPKWPQCWTRKETSKWMPSRYNST